MDADTLLEQAEFSRIIQWQMKIHENWQSSDWYKLIHQMASGPAHVTDFQRAQQELNDEWGRLGKVRKGEMLLEMIDPRSQVMRVNLRLFRKVGGTPQKMWEIFKRSVEHSEAAPHRVMRYWNWLLDLSKDLPGFISEEDLQTLGLEMQKQNFPAIHHSAIYVESNAPAYRVVLKRFWDGFNGGGGE